MVKKESVKPAKKKAPAAAVVKEKTAPAHKHAPAAVKEKAPVKKTEARYHFAIGRRKTAQAKVRLFVDGKGDISVNNRKFEDYFPTSFLQRAVLDPLTVLGLEKKINIVAMTNGGGVSAQAKAIGLGIARALLKVEPLHRAVLKKQGVLTRDARKKERKKPGLKRARRAPQFSKR